MPSTEPAAPAWISPLLSPQIHTVESIVETSQTDKEISLKRLLLNLGSLKLTVIILVSLLFILATGTIIESLHGAAKARVVYGSALFMAMLGAVAVNIITSISTQRSSGLKRLGFLLVHASVLLVLLGALATMLLRVEGQLEIWEGETATTISIPGASGETRQIPLGFGIRLDAFEIDVYPGTRRPAMYRSRVTLIDAHGEVDSSAVIEMNHELAHGGLRFFQSSYRISHAGRMTVLSVSRDPGQPIVFTGYLLLVLGLLVVMRDRSLRRRAAPAGPPAPNRHPDRAPDLDAAPAGTAGTIPALAIALILVGIAGPALAQQAQAPTSLDPEDLKRVPVQHDGRVMALDTLARETVWKVTGRRHWIGEEPIRTILKWAFDPTTWANQPMIRIGSEELSTELGLGRSRYATFSELMGSPGLRALLDDGRAASRRGEPTPRLSSSALELENRLRAMHQILTRQAFRLEPGSDDPQEPWLVPATLVGPADLLAASERARAAGVSGYPDLRSMDREVLYNKVRTGRLAWLLLLGAAAATALSWRSPELRLGLISKAAILAGFVIMTWGLAMRWMVAGRIPASDMYESLLFLAWGVGLFAAVAALGLGSSLVMFNSALLSGATSLIIDIIPMDPFIHPMPPVLAGTPWLAIHVPIIMVSYSLLALSALVAHMRLGLEMLGRQRAGTARVLDEAHYWYVLVGSVMLLVGILTGSIWAASSWGRYWGWDPKEVWSLIAFLAYMAILHARSGKMLRPVGIAAASILAFGTILMTYLGVNFVLASGLHSYGFGGSRVAGWLIVTACFEICFVAAGLWAAHRSRASDQEPDQDDSSTPQPDLTPTEPLADEP